MTKLAPLFAILLALALLLASCGANQGTLAGRINGQPVTAESFNDSYRGHYTNFQVLNNRAPSREERELIKQQTWTDAAKGVILRQWFTKYKISATPSEVVDTLSRNIPSYILRSPLFMTDGVFDPKIYNQSLLYDSPQNLAPLRQDYLDTKVPIMKLKRELIANELLDKGERKLITGILQSNADVEFTLLELADIDPYVASEEVRAHYQKNLADYRLEPFVSLSYATLEVLPSRTDIRLTNLYADSLYQELSAGTPVSALLEDSHPLASTLVYKNSGFLDVDSLDPLVYAQLSALDEGAWALPLPTASGTSLHQLEKRTKSMCSFNSLCLPYQPTGSSIEVLRPEAELAVKLARMEGLATACEEMSLPRTKVHKAHPDSLWYPDAQIVAAIRLLLPGQPAGHVFDPVYSPTTRQWVIVELNEAALEVHLPLASVEAGIREFLSRDKREQLALQISQRIISGQDPTPDNATVRHFEGLSPTSLALGKHTPIIFHGILRRHLQNQPQEAFLMDDLVWMPRVISVSRDAKLKVDEAQIQAVFASSLPTNWFDDWMEQQLRKATIQKYMD